MPINTGKDREGCFVRWGQKGAKYHYICGDEESRKEAKKKAIAQAVAAGGDLEAVGAQLNILKGSYKFEKLRKIGFDWDGTASTAKGKEMIQEAIDRGDDVYIISARENKIGMIIHGIPQTRIFAVGSNDEKVKKVKELGITEFYDNNRNVVLKLPRIGRLFLTIELASYTDYPEAAKENAKTALRWAEKNGWGDCGTAVGKARANQLANGEAISEDTISRMASFERHRQNSQRDLGDGCGRLMWLAWGGDEGIAWAQRKLKEIRIN